MGLFIAIVVIITWLVHLVYSLLFVSVEASNPWLYVHMLIQAYLFTGLFITGHDAMHGTVKPFSKRTNTIVGHIATLLYAGLWYPRLIVNHHKHHDFAGTEKDPDYCTCSQNFFIWYFVFMWRYLTIWQILIMAGLFNVLLLAGFSEIELILLWIIPAFLSTFQMFYFGVWAPHRQPHKDSMLPYRARTQRKNHVWAMLSCYFFGYHWEHHHSPGTPWWQLYKAKTPANT